MIWKQNKTLNRHLHEFPGRDKTTEVNIILNKYLFKYVKKDIFQYTQTIRGMTLTDYI